MDTQSAIHSTFVIERKLAADPERVFRAFSDPAEKRRWFFESDRHQLESHELDFSVGGKERGQLKFGPGSPVSGMTCVNETVYQDIVPARRIVAAYKMIIGGHCISAALTTFEFLPAESGTDLIVTHQGAYFEGADGAEIRKGGWNHLLDKLAVHVAG